MTNAICALAIDAVKDTGRRHPAAAKGITTTAELMVFNPLRFEA